MAVAGVLSGLVAFGWHPLAVLDLQHSTAFSSGQSTLAPTAALGRLALAVLVIAGAMLSTFAFAFLCSTLTEQAFTAVAGGVLFGLVSRSLDNIPGLHALSPWLPLTDTGTDVWNGIFFQPSDWSGLRPSVRGPRCVRPGPPGRFGGRLPTAGHAQLTLGRHRT